MPLVVNSTNGWPTMTGASNTHEVRRPSRAASDAGGNGHPHPSTVSFRSLPVRSSGNPAAGTAGGLAPSAAQSYMKMDMYRNAEPLDATSVQSNRPAGRSNIEHPSTARPESRMNGAQGADTTQTPTTSRHPSKSQSSGGCPPIPIISNFELRPGAKEQLRNVQGLISSLGKPAAKPQLRHVNSDISGETTRLRSDMYLIEERVSKMESVFVTSAAKNSDKMHQMERLYQSKTSTLENRNRDLISANKYLVHTIRSLGEDNKDLQRQLNNHNGQARRMATLQRQLNEHKELSNVLVQELNEVWEENGDKEKTIHDLQEERDRANIKAEKLALQAQRLRTKLDALENADAAKEQEHLNNAPETELEKTLQSGMERIRKLELELKEERAELSMLRARLVWTSTHSKTDKDVISPSDGSFTGTTTTDTLTVTDTSDGELERYI